jgi:cyanophycinase
MRAFRLALLACGATLALAAHPAHAGTVVLAGGNLALYPQPNADVWDEVLRLAHAAAPDVERPRMAVLLSASASSLTARTDYFQPTRDDAGHVTYESYEHIFTAMGFAPTLVPLAIDDYASPSYLDGIPDAHVASDAARAAEVRGAAVVFLNGGDQMRHVRALRRDDGGDAPLLAAIREVLARGGVVIGTSAGSMAQSEWLFGDGDSWGYLHRGTLRRFDARNTLVPVAYDRDPSHVDDATEIDAAGYVVDKTTRERSMVRPTLSDDASVPAASAGSVGREGLGFLPRTLVDTHVGARGRIGRLVVALTQTGPLADAPLGIGVDENTALFVDLATRRATVRGEFGAFFADVAAARARTARDGSNVVEGARLTYLTQGDAATLDGGGVRDVTTTKPLLGALDEAPRTDAAADAFADGVTASMLADLVTGASDFVTARASYDAEATTTLPRYDVRLGKRAGATRGFRGEVAYATRDGGHATKTAVSVDAAALDLNVGAP